MKRYLIGLLAALMFFSTVLPAQEAFANEPEAGTVVQDVEQNEQTLSQEDANIVQPQALPLLAGVIIGYAVRYGAQKAIIKYGQKAVVFVLNFKN